MMPHEPDSELLEYETEQEDPGPVQPIDPLPVHVCAPVVTVPTVSQHVTTRTVLLTTANAVQQILPQDPLRVMAWLLPKIDNNVVLCHSLTQAQDPANADPALAAPNGALVSAALTAAIPVPGTQAMWMAGNTFPTRVGLIIERRTP